MSTLNELFTAHTTDSSAESKKSNIKKTNNNNSNKKTTKDGRLIHVYVCFEAFQHHVVCVYFVI